MYTSRIKILDIIDLLSFFVFTTEIYIILSTLVQHKLINFYLSYFTRNTYDT